MSLTSCELGQIYDDCKSTAECHSAVANVVDHALMMHGKNIEFDPEALKQDLQQYKQMVWSLRDENSHLKVKLRRLEDIVKKKQKIVDTHYLGIHNKLLVKEAIHQVSHRVETLQNDNQDLREEVMAKDLTIRKLRRQLESYSAYKQGTTCRRKVSSTVFSARASHSSNNPETPSSVDPDVTLEEVTEEVIDTIKNFSLNNVSKPQIANRWVGDDDCEEQNTERAVTCSLLVETPHEEIEKLHTGFKDILSEVGKLKNSVSQIHEDHARTVCEMRLREKMLMSHLYDKEAELAYKTSSPKATTFLQNHLAVNEKKPKDVKKHKARTAFVRITPMPKPDKLTPKRKHRGLDIRTASRNSLHDETDMRLYIDEVLRDMNYQK